MINLLGPKRAFGEKSSASFNALLDVQFCRNDADVGFLIGFAFAFCECFRERNVVLCENSARDSGDKHPPHKRVELVGWEVGRGNG